MELDRDNEYWRLGLSEVIEGLYIGIGEHRLFA